MTTYEDNACFNSKHMYTRLVSDDIEHCVLSWFEKVRSMNNPGIRTDPTRESSSYGRKTQTQQISKD